MHGELPVKDMLPPRPNLDHLRRQAKSLLAALAAGEKEAIGTIHEFLPAAKGMDAARVRAAGWRLADAQSAIARKSGFESWPRLARHVEQLRALEGTWSFERLEVDGVAIPAEGLAASRLLIDGDRFRTEAPEGNYEGVFNIDVEAAPHRIDIEFVEGPEAGNWNYGIFRLDGDELELCLDVNGKPAPREFRTSPGSGHACELLKRSSGERPASVTGGDRAKAGTAGGAPLGRPGREADFPFVESPTLKRLQGEWTAVKLVRDGQEVPGMMVKTGRRSAQRNEIKIFFGGQVIIHALVRIEESAAPIRIDYYNLAGPGKGTIQEGIMEWRDGDACFCMAAPGQARPADFTCGLGSGRILSQWRPKS
jgi:uncharacterized protein (TIGR03067 family)